MYRLIAIKTQLFLILKFIVKFLPNYKTKKKSKIIENKIYKKFSSYNENEKWFCNNLYFLSYELKKLNNVKKILEIGSYEGRSCIFFCNFFNNAHVTCVDTWSGSDEHLNIKFKDIENNFNINIQNHKLEDRVLKIKDNSNNFFTYNKKKFDLIYVDGDHETNQVKKDIYNSWDKLNNGGYLILDDYTWWWYKDLRKNPASSINNFINNKLDEIDLKNLIIWKQVIIKKK